MMDIGISLTNKEQKVTMNENEYVVKSVQILAKKRSGKSYTASKIAEELLANNIPIIIMDPVSAHYGLKEEFKILLFSGNWQKYTDYEIHRGDRDFVIAQAIVIAKFLATSSKKESAIIDLNTWSDGDQQLFGHHFFKTLYQLNIHRRHLFVEEADIFAAQMIQFENEALYCRHALDNIVRRGGAKGLGTTIITQRPALVSKNILSQSDLTIALNIQAAQDLKAFNDIIRDDDELSKEAIANIKNEIKKAPAGKAFFYSPQWLKMREFVRVGIKRTFHAGATLEDGPISDINVISVDEMKEDLDKISNEIEHYESNKVEKINKMIDKIPPGASVIIKTKIEDIEKLKKSHTEEIKIIESEKQGLEKQIEDLKIFKNAFVKIKEVMELLNPKLVVNLTSQFRPSKNDTELQRYIEADKISQYIYDLYIDGYFASPRSISDIHIAIHRDFVIPKSESPGGPNATRFKRKISNHMDHLSRKPLRIFAQIASDNNEILFKKWENEI